jgi:hypothetical protein
VYNGHVHAPTPTIRPSPLASGHPQIVFFCELGATELLELLARAAVLETLAARSYGVALATLTLDDATADAVRLLHGRQIPVVAWLQLGAAEGLQCNMRNYPQVVERYRAFHGWAHAHGLQFAAVGLEIAPAGVAISPQHGWGPRHLLRRLRQARENLLFATARAAYSELIAGMHHDGYEVHLYQLPFVADDRRAGSTLAQRALEIVDLPADVEVLACYSSVAADRLANDLGGALIRSYGPEADGIGVGVVGGESLPSLSWEALERDLLLAAHHTDTLYVYSLEGCVERGLLPRIAQLDWDVEPRVLAWKRALVAAARLALVAGLFLARFSRALFAWLGWGLFALLVARRLNARGR